MTAGKAFRLRRQTPEGEQLHIPNHPACPGCYRPIDRHGYCSTRCWKAHQKLRGTSA